MLRLFILFLSTMRLSKCGMDASDELNMRVWLTDIDLNFHMNNAKYLKAAQLGRVFYAKRTGLLSSLRKKRIGIVVVGTHITYHKSLATFSKYRLITKLIGCDEKWFYFEHRFEQQGKVATRVLVRMVFMVSGKRMSTEKAALELGLQNIEMNIDPEISSKLDPVN